MKKIISFSLWGNNSKYTLGAIENIKLAKEIYPTWICRFYIDKNLDLGYVEQISSFSNTEIILCDESVCLNKMMWRFLAIDDIDVDIMISRDADSRLSIREKICIDIWENSDKIFHSIIDHPYHYRIMGGMWGIKKNSLFIMKELINQWASNNDYNNDQTFLNTIIYPKIENSYLLHDSITLKNFPIPFDNDYHFIGEIFEGNNQRADHYEILMKYISENML